MEPFRYIEGVATLKLNERKCVGCAMCEVVCPHGVFLVDESKARVLDKDRCMECGACVRNCPSGALSVKSGVGSATAVLRGWLTRAEPLPDFDD